MFLSIAITKMLKTLSSSIVLLLIFANSALAEECKFRGTFDDKYIADLRLNGRLIPLEMAFEDYIYMSYDVCRAIGLAYDDVCTTYPLMGQVDFNALAIECSGVPKVIYDRRLSSEVGFYGAQAILAHELGHILCKHLWALSMSPHDKEIEADKFAGAVMRTLNLSKEMALSYLPLLSEQTSYSHPNNSDRKAALIWGWQNPDFTNKCLRK